ncbi:zinc finger FYVE domain-containing protein 1-like [Tachypleus tridentatus]|uniref:zinc finger FYVE domain-containing protein 1-like n=1 Tax=Tachypleus tridentatus TaxID=6853 RepID=UPI003FD51A58
MRSPSACSGIASISSPRPGRIITRKLPTTRPSRKVCQERLACKGAKPEASYFCTECGTYQCIPCETLLHENIKFLLHEREQLKPVAAELLCQLNCEDQNLADICCIDCSKNLCFKCDRICHSDGCKKVHRRNPFEPETEDFLSCTEGLLEEGEKSEIEEENVLITFTDTSNNKMISLGSENMYSIPDVACETLAVERKGPPTLESNAVDLDGDSSISSFLLVDEKENIKVNSETDFIAKLDCPSNTPVKVVSIFGNTGEGKSHTLNHTFFRGKEVFKTSITQSSCTVGVWAAYDPLSKVIILDTEGLLGTTANHNQRTRLLLKVLAVSDIVIYRTRAERLHNDLFTFLGDASKAYCRHFSRELKAASERCKFEGPLSSLGPAVIIFHETLHTQILKEENGHSPEEILKLRFQKLSQSVDAFSALEYVGTQTSMLPTSFLGLQRAVQKQLQNSSVRSARSSSVVYQALKVLNEKFNGELEKTVPSSFPDQYFACNNYCLSCSVRCSNSMNHIRDGTPHVATTKCRYQHQYDNRIFMCKACYERGEEVLVFPKTSAASDSTWMGLAKFAWSGYVIECINCGIIYRSREYWFGNKDPWETVVRTDIKHIWQGEPTHLQSTQNYAQRVIDSVQYLSETVSAMSVKPTKTLSSWVADQLAPSYWIPNSQVTHCGQCKKEFDELDMKHHCRACGYAFCEDCSSRTRPVPERGWGNTPVRVCDECYKYSEELEPPTPNLDKANTEVAARKVGEALQNTLGTVISVFDYPIGFIKDSARPTYWVPDHLITCCCVCKEPFTSKTPLHHCRACGQGVCDHCSPGRHPVPTQGWDHPVRVCTTCEGMKNL